MVSGARRSPRARWTIALVAAVLAAIWLAMLLGGTGFLDQRIYGALYAGDNPPLVAIARAVTWLGDPNVLIPATFVIAAGLWWHGHFRTGLTLIAVTLIGRGLNQVQKLEVSRIRPDLEPHLVIEQSNSFPSGHSSGSMIFFLTLALLLTHRGPWRRWAAAGAVLVAILVGISRVMLGVHWPSDVVGGWVFGLLWVLLTLRIAEDLIERRALKR